MEPTHYNEQKERGEKQIAFNDLFLELQRLPNGPDAALDEKEDIYYRLLKMLVKKDFFPESDYDALVQKVQEAFEYSLMTEEGVKEAQSKKQSELDVKYRAPGFKE